MKSLRLSLLLSLLVGCGVPQCACSQEDVSRIAGLSAWYRADHVTQGSNNVLTALNDCSKNARHIVVGAKPPAVVTQAIHGQPVLRFSGDETPLVADGNNWSAEGFTAFVVASYAVIPEQPRFRDNLGYAVETPGQSLISDSGVAGLALGLNWNGRPGMSAGIIVADPSTAYEPPYPNEQASDLVIAAGKFYAFTYASREGKHNSKANAWDCWLTVSVSANGTASSILTTPFISMQAMNGGRRLQLGAAGDRDRFRGDLAEVILFNTELSEADRTTVLAYLRTKYGLRDDVSRLPADPVSITPTLDKQTFWFRDAVTVTMSTGTADGEIRYSTNGQAPSQTSPRYAGPIKLTASSAIMAQTFAPGRAPSPVTTATFVRLAPAQPTTSKLTAGWKFCWGDEFHGPAIDQTRWGREIGYIRNSEAQYYSERPENARIDDGNLLIQGLHDNWNGHKYTSASVSTENNMTLTYGRYELRAKIDVRSGSWPAWWLWSRPDAAGWPQEGEIDMLEYYTGKCLFNVVDGTGRFYGQRRKIVLLGGDRWAKEFHVWTMDWDSRKIDLYLDGTLVFHFLVDLANGTGPNGTNPYRNPQTKKMVLNQALGGSCGGFLNAADCPFAFRVDWIRVHVWSEETAYTLTVNGGVGSGPYVAGTKASITAQMAPIGYAFDKWVIQGDAAVDNPSNPSATITVPTSDVTIIATYRLK